jgi:hypothetical protein
MSAEEELTHELLYQLDEVLHPFMLAHPEMTAEEARAAIHDLGCLADLWEVWRDREARQQWTAEAPEVTIQ